MRDFFYRRSVERQVKIRQFLRKQVMKPFRFIGFEELGNADGFDTAVLELRLLQSGL